MKKLVFVMLLMSLCCGAFAQKTTFQHKGVSYPAITFTFTTYVSYNNDDRLFPDKDVNVIIAKKDTGGLIEISLKIPSDKDLCTYFHKCGISGDITIDLDNGDKIVCKDKGINDFLNGKASAVYELSAKDMELLRKHNIEVIHFYMQTFSSKANYVAANFHHFVSDTPDEFTQKNERVETTKVPTLMELLK